MFETLRPSCLLGNHSIFEGNNGYAVIKVILNLIERNIH